jgi:uncharacterized RDD family membrane protein YckC
MPAPGITVLKQNVPWGPFTREQIEEGIFRGDFTVRSLAHAPGLNEWLPLGEVLDFLHRAGGTGLPILPPVPMARALPPVPGAIAPKPEPPILPTMQSVFEPSPEPLKPPPLTPPLPPPVVEKVPVKPAPVTPPQPVPPPPPQPEVQLTPASFFPRFIAFVIDFVILFFPVGILYIIGALLIEIPGAFSHIDHESRMQEWSLLQRNMRDLAWLVAVGFGWIYGAGLESSRAQATVGKRWMGIKVTDARGERLSFLHTTGRYAAKYLSALPCFLGFIMALFSSRNLTLHDRIAGTRAVRD